MVDDLLSSWRHGPTGQAIVDVVRRRLAETAVERPELRERLP
jgi:hypothetical protein